MSSPQLLRASLESLRNCPDDLIEIIVRQAAALEELQKQVKDLQDQIRDLNDRNGGLQKRIEELETAAARPAAPFRIKDKHRVLSPKVPGRKAGHAAAFRSIPSQIDQRINVPLERCPECNSALSQVRCVVQYIEDIPPVRPQVTELTTHRGYCSCCQKEVRSSHPLQVSLAEGAAAVQLGPNALAVACQLNKQHGLTLRKTQAVLQSLFGLAISPGGLVQAMKRMAQRLRPRYEAMLEELRHGPVMHSDETSWWVGGPGWWLWVFTTPTITIYHVAQGRSRAVLLDLMGLDFAGVLVSDCLAIYDGVNPRQHKCYAHHLKAISQAIEQAPSDYLTEVRGLLKGAMALKESPQEMEAQKQSDCRRALERRADELLTLPRAQGLEERVRRRLFKQRDHLFTFLDHAAVPATNNLAERQLRPAVIARKVSCGNKTQAGAQAWEVLASLAATCKQRAQSFLEIITSVARPPPLLGR